MERLAIVERRHLLSAPTTTPELSDKTRAETDSPRQHEYTETAPCSYDLRVARRP